MATQTGSLPLPGMSISWRQFAGLAGIAGVVLFVIGAGLQGSTPMADDTAAEVRAWYADNESAFLAGGLIVGFGVMLGLLPFFVYLRGVLATAEGGDATWSRINYLGAILFIIMGGIGSTFFSAIAVNAAALEDDAVILALQYLGYSIFTFVPLTLVPFFLGLGFVSLRTGVFASWIAWLSLILAPLSIISTGASLDVANPGALMILGYVCVLGFGIVILATSVSLLRSKE